MPALTREQYNSGEFYVVGRGDRGFIYRHISQNPYDQREQSYTAREDYSDASQFNNLRHLAAAGGRTVPQITPADTSSTGQLAAASPSPSPNQAQNVSYAAFRGLSPSEHRAVIQAYRGATFEGATHQQAMSIMAQAAQQAIQGGPNAVAAFMRANGYPQSGAWCGEFAAAVVRSVGGTPPQDPQIASNWRNFGTQVTNPQPGDIAVRRGVPTGATGSHVTFVGGIDPRTGTFTRVGGNQGASNQSPTVINRRPLSEYQFYRAPWLANASQQPASGSGSGRPTQVAESVTRGLSRLPGVAGLPARLANAGIRIAAGIHNQRENQRAAPDQLPVIRRAIPVPPQIPPENVPIVQPPEIPNLPQPANSPPNFLPPAFDPQTAPIYGVPSPTPPANNAQFADLGGAVPQGAIPQGEAPEFAQQTPAELYNQVIQPPQSMDYMGGVGSAPDTFNPAMTEYLNAYLNAPTPPQSDFQLSPQAGIPNYQTDLTSPYGISLNDIGSADPYINPSLDPALDPTAGYFQGLAGAGLTGMQFQDPNAGSISTGGDMQLTDPTSGAFTDLPTDFSSLGMPGTGLDNSQQQNAIPSQQQAFPNPESDAYTVAQPATPGAQTYSGPTFEQSAPPPEELPSGMTPGNATGVFSGAGPFSTGGVGSVGPQFDGGGFSDTSNPANTQLGFSMDPDQAGSVAGASAIPTAASEAGIVGIDAPKHGVWLDTPGPPPPGPQYISGWNWYHPQEGTDAIHLRGYYLPSYTQGYGTDVAMPTDKPGGAPVSYNPAPTTTTVAPSGLSSGGKVPGHDKGYDSQLTMLEPGEIVLNEAQQREINPKPGLRSDLARAIDRAKSRRPKFLPLEMRFAHAA